MKLLNPLEQMLFDDNREKGRREGLDQGLEQGLKRGLEKGLEQGLVQGRAEGAAALLERLLTQRFGPLPKTVLSKLKKASVAEVEAWGDALVAAESLKQVFSATPAPVKPLKKLPLSLN